MKLLSLLCLVLGLLFSGCAYEDVEVQLKPSYSYGPAVISVFPAQLGERIKMVELDGVKLGGGGGLSAARVESGNRQFLVRVSKSGWGSAAQYDFVTLKATIEGGGSYHLEISKLTRILQIRDARSGQVVGESRYRILW